MKPTVLDTSALLAMFFAEPGMDLIGDLFEQAATADRALLIGAINWAEVLYKVERKQGKPGVETACRFERTMPLEVVALDRELAESAAELKVTHHLGWADACAVALAKQRRAVLVTGDRDFKPLEAEVEISWLQ